MKGAAQAARWLLAAMALLGLIGVVPISLDQFTQSQACPHVGPVPACYLVMVSYALILGAVIVSNRSTKWFFAAGWLIVFGLAATGTTMELFGAETCPRSAGGTPTCFYSLALSVVVGALFLFANRMTPPKPSID